MHLTLIGILCNLQLSGGNEKGPLEVKKAQNHCTKVSYAGINGGEAELSSYAL
jgi:hypothetical protein